MDQQLKQRLVGAAVLIALGVIFIPMLLDDTVRESGGIRGTNIPPKPEGEFSSSIIPLQTEPQAAAEQPQLEDNGTAPESTAQMSEPPATAPQTSPVAPPAAPEDASTRVGLTAWVIQLGSFNSRENAVTLEDRLRTDGYSSFVEKTGTEEKPVYRVRVGPELMRSDAEALRDKLKAEVGLEGIVVRYP